MSEYLPTSEVHKGDRFTVDDFTVTVLQLQVMGVLVNVQSPSHTRGWSERMPLGIPAHWQRIEGAP